MKVPRTKEYLITDLNSNEFEFKFVQMAFEKTKNVQAAGIQPFGGGLFGGGGG